MSDKKKPLSKSDFAKVIAGAANLDTAKEAEAVINAFVAGATKALSDGENISLVGFGNFEIRHRPERQGRNPSSGEAMTIKASNAVGFKAGKALKDAVN
tara:strand:- start:9 stop:305 length:297 start_codon:yes stop_codon:yes gene_type:complete